MIPLIKSKELLEKYNKWKSSILNELDITFNEYYNNLNSKWIQQSNLQKIQEFLFPTSHFKCAYCERVPNHGGSYLEVEHFYPKKTEEFKHLVFDLNNLLPSCNQCNIIKKEYKINDIEMINPYNENNISEHLFIDNDLIIRSKSEKGKSFVTILASSINSKKYLNQNNTGYVKGCLSLRLEIKLAIDFKINNLNKEREHLQNYLADSDYDINNQRVIKSMNNLYEMLQNLILDINEKHEFTATYASIILNNFDFKQNLIFLKKYDKFKYLELQNLIEKKQIYNLAN